MLEDTNVTPETAGSSGSLSKLVASPEAQVARGFDQSIDCLEMAYWYQCECVWGDRNRTLSPFDRAVAAAVYCACRAALNDSRTDRSLIRTISAPTGSGKTTFALAFVAALVGNSRDPGWNYQESALIVVETIEQADDIYRQLISHPGIDDDVVGIWTSYHDANLTAYQSGRYGFDELKWKPAKRQAREELENYPIVIVTHSFHTSRNGPLARYYNDEERTVTLVDERMQLTDVYVCTPGDIAKARDLVAEVPVPLHRNNPRQAWIDPKEEEEETDDALQSRAVALLSEAAAELERLWEFDEAARRRPLATVASLACSPLSVEEVDHLVTVQRDGHKEVVRSALCFVKAMTDGCAFLSTFGSSKATRFVGYDYGVPSNPGTILLDATADIDGVSQIVTNRVTAEMPVLSYEDLTIKHLDPPEWIPSKRPIRELMQRHSTAVDYGKWLRETVIDNTKPGDLVLAVTHKALFETHEIVPQDPGGWELAEDLEGRKVRWIHWGIGIGSNKWRDASDVFLFGEFHLPRNATIATILGLRKQKATKANLEPFQMLKPGKTSDVAKISSGHLSRWEKQLATRGNARNIEDGVCGEQRLFVTGEFSRWLLQKERLFPGCTFDGGDHSNKKTGLKGVAAVVSFLSSPDVPEVVTFAELKKETGVDMSKHGSRLLKDPHLLSFLETYRWKVVRGKRGRGHQPSRFCRHNLSGN